MASLHDLWFILVAVLFVGFFFLEGFDFGVGMATRFLGHNELERRVLINTIGPFWDANEVLAFDWRRRHFRGIPKLVCNDAERLLHSVCHSAACVNGPRGRV